MAGANSLGWYGALAFNLLRVLRQKNYGEIQDYFNR
jgi:hypothetical protein